MKTLIVDDDLVLTDVLSFTLRRAGFEVVAAHDGQSALDRWQAESPDLIILDLNLPKKDGREVLMEIKGDTDLRRVPVVIFSSSEAEADILSFYHHHANCYICKPLDLDAFIEVVGQIGRFWIDTVILPTKVFS